MIDLKKTRTMYDMFIDKKILTTQELLGLGFSRNDLTKLVKDEKLRRVKVGFYELPNAKGLLLRYSDLLKKKKFERGKKALDRCLEIEPDNGSVNVRFLIECINVGDYEQAFNCLDVLFEKTNQFYVREHNLWLYLLSFLTEVPERYKDKLKSIDYKSIEVHPEDKRYKAIDTENKIRSVLINRHFMDAEELVKSFKPKKVNEVITYRLALLADKADKNRRKQMYQLVADKDYVGLVRMLEKIENYHGLSYAERIIYMLASDMVSVTMDKSIPRVISGGTVSFEEAIRNHNYNRAMELTSDYNVKNKLRGNKVITILLERIVSEIEKLELQKNSRPVGANAFVQFTSCLMKQDVDSAFKCLDDYLSRIDKLQFREYIVDLVKLSLLENDMSFTEPMLAISKLSRDDYQFDVSIYIQDFYFNLASRDYKRAAIYLDIVSMSSNIGGIPIDVSDMKKTLVAEMENAGLKDEALEVSMPKPKCVPEASKAEEKTVEVQVTDNVVEQFHTLPSIVQDVIDGDNVAMLEPMSEQDAKMVLDMVGHVANLKSAVLEAEDGKKRVVLRYFNKRNGVSVDIGDVLRRADKAYKCGLYNECIDLYESVLPKFEDPKPFIYAKLGMSYYRTTLNDDFCEAIDYLTLATAESKNGDGNYDYTDLINRLKSRSGYNGLKVNVGTTAGASSAKVSAPQYKLKN